MKPRVFMGRVAHATACSGEIVPDATTCACGLSAWLWHGIVVTDAFLVHETVERHFTDLLAHRIGSDKRWAVGRRTPRAVERYGEDAIFFSARQFTRLTATIHAVAGCPPGCPARRHAATLPALKTPAARALPK